MEVRSLNNIAIKKQCYILGNVFCYFFGKKHLSNVLWFQNTAAIRLIFHFLKIGYTIFEMNVIIIHPMDVVSNNQYDFTS